MSSTQGRWQGKDRCPFCLVGKGQFHNSDCAELIKIRTLRQNRALHLYFQMVAQALNDAGLDMRAVLKPEVDIPWTKETVKDFLWRPIQRIMLRKESTTDLERKDLDQVFETMNRHLAKHGVHKLFPSVESIFEQLRLNDRGTRRSKLKH